MSALLAVSSVLHAQTTTYSWDVNGAGAGTGGTGTWGTSQAFWTADDTSFFIWTSITNQAGAVSQADAIASFGGTAGTVSLANQSYQAHSVEFLVDGYVLQSSSSTARTITNVSGNVTVGAGLTATMGNAIRFGGSSGFTKLGDGTLVLGNTANTTSGTNTVSAGTLVVGANQALGSGVTAALIVSGGATLDLAGFALTNALSSSAGTITSSASGGLLSANNSADADFSGVLSGSLGLTKTGGGVLTLSGSTANTYTGTTTLSVGSLTLNKTSGVNAIGGDLVIGDGTSTDTVSLSAANQVADTSVVTMTSSGRLNLNGNAETIGALVGGVAGVQNINLGGGALTVSGTSASSFAGNIATGTGGVLTFGGASGAAMSGVLSGTGGLVKTGAGTLTLSATNTYSGATTISNGTLVVDGRVAGSGLEVKNGGELGGSGTVGAAVTVESGGTIAPGNSPGTLTLTNGLTWNAGGNYDWEIFNIAGPAGTGWDLINVQGGALTFSGLSAGTPFNINIYSLDGTNPDSFGPLAGLAPFSTYSWKILQHNTTITGFSASNFNLNASSFVNDVSSGLFTLELGDGNTSIYLVYTTGQPVPEPGTWAAAALLTAAGYFRWRRRSSSAA